MGDCPCSSPSRRSPWSSAPPPPDLPYIPGGGLITPTSISPGLDNPAEPYQFGFPSGAGPVFNTQSGSPASKPAPPGLEADPKPLPGSTIVPFKTPVVN